MAREPDWSKVLSPEEAEEARRSGPELMAWGGLIMLAGLLAVLSPIWTGLATVTAVGLALVVSAIAYVAHGMRGRGTGGYMPHGLFAGVLAGVAGIMLVARPIITAEALTLLVAVVLLAAGAVRVISALAQRHLQWRWSLFDGIVTAVLGLLLFAQWPAAALWIVGVVVGIALFVSGGLMLGAVLAGRRMALHHPDERRREAEEEQRPPPVH